MITQLQSLRKTLAEATHELDCESLLRVIDKDLAFEGTISASIAAPDMDAADRLKGSVSSAYPLFRIDLPQPYLSKRDWDEGILQDLRRADAFIALTGARHFLPAILLRLLESATVAGVPSLLLVSGMGRMRDPRALADTLSAELQGLSFRQAPHLAFLDDGKFTCEGLDSVLAGFLGPIHSAPHKAEAARDVRLWDCHATAALELARSREDFLRGTEVELRAFQADREQTEHSLLATGDALPAFWQTAVLEIAGRLWISHEERTSSSLVGDRYTDLETIHSSWFRTFREEFESRIAAWVRSAAWHLRIDPDELPELTKPLCRIVDRAYEKMRAAVEETEQSLGKSRGKRDLSTRRNQLARNTVLTSMEKGDSTAQDASSSTDAQPTIVDTNQPADGGGFGLGSLVSEVGLVTNTALNLFAKKRMTGILLNLSEEVRRLGGRTTDELREEVVRWVATCRNSRGDILAAGSFDLKETERQLGVIANLTSRLIGPV